MSSRLFIAGIGSAIVLMLAVVLIAPGPDNQRGSYAAAEAIDPAEHARTIEELRPPKRERPVIAILALNAATEVTDVLVPYGVLKRANIAEVTVVAELATPVPLHPFSALGQGRELLRIEPQSTTRAFDERHPEGADYVVVPALMPRNDQLVTDWIVTQRRKGAKIVSVCAGALTLAAAGLLDGRRATTHWAYIRDLQKAHPTMKWVRDRRYVTDHGISTSTGITATVPAMVALVEAIAGRPRAERLARDLGVDNWDARHPSAAFQLTWAHQRTFLRNWLSFWRHETIGVPVSEGVDEIALALTVDAYSRTASSTVITVGRGSEVVHSRHGLALRPKAHNEADEVDRMLPPPRADAPAATLDRELAQIASRFDRPTAEIVALAMEYPWPARLKGNEGAQRTSTALLTRKDR